LAQFACLSLGIECVAILAIYCLQGFHAWGFQLEAGLMHWLGAATVGTVASLATIVYRETFRR